MSRVLADRFPREYTSFLSSRQQAGRLWSDARRFVDLHGVVTVVAAILSLAIVAFAMLGFEIPTSELHLIVWVALIGNASLVSNLSSVQERYQGRLVWMIALAVLVTALGYRFRTQGLARGDSETSPDSSSSISR
ncbi:MAG: hypothetical protein FJ144_25335 [Deltaproteobacteria bacterium]|nr:hypothetical protein [Deltaproteobacteria bacterium]